ncbi:MAG TPA: hypothetical protein VJ302_03445 [Blastocatellia bacterium]|nr:hypothetical protein [Blastocatellia bacterium]
MPTNSPKNIDYVVNATELNLRREPAIDPENILVRLPGGHRVRRLEPAPIPNAPDWWRVMTTVHNTDLEGFTCHRFLVPADQFNPPPPHNRISEVHLTTSQPILRGETRGRAFPLNEGGQPRRTGTTQAARTAELGRIIQWLDVEQNARYLPIPGTTFCNIYTFDFCCLANVYIPRVWWTATAIAQLMAGQTVTPAYGVSVTEKNANNLYDWFNEFGPGFGWARSFDLNDLQRAANHGQVVVICAQRRDLNRSGHICLVVPETSEHRATRSGGEVTIPLQSQAGANNFRYGGRRWWTGEEFGGFGFWKHR